jgi:GGDEF domain-containing protein
LSCSIGVSAQLPTAASQPENLLKCADTALYAAKQNGRAWVMCFDVKAGGAM